MAESRNGPASARPGGHEASPRDRNRTPSTGSIRIRKGTPDDMEEVAAIEKVSFTNPWHPHTFRRLVTQGRVHILVADDEEEEAVVGYAVMWWVHAQGELGNLAVKETHQGRGIGSALLDQLLDDARERGVRDLFLEVRMSNDPAFRLYRSRGFVQVSVRKGYYRNPPEDARILVKVLGDAGEET